MNNFYYFDLHIPISMDIIQIILQTARTNQTGGLTNS